MFLLLGCFVAVSILLPKSICIVFLVNLSLFPYLLDLPPFAAFLAPDLVGQIYSGTVRAPLVSLFPLVLIENVFGGNPFCSLTCIVTLLHQVLSRLSLPPPLGVSLAPVCEPSSPRKCGGSSSLLPTVSHPSFVAVSLVGCATPWGEPMEPFFGLSAPCGKYLGINTCGRWPMLPDWQVGSGQGGDCFRPSFYFS